MKTTPDGTSCRICGNSTEEIGTKYSALLKTDFLLRQCKECGFSFVENPHPNQSEIYSDEYYAGRGADPLVDYVTELKQPEKTIRVYEWRGLLRAIKSLVSIDASTRWLDYGCGNAGLVRHVRHVERCEIFGYEEGSIVRAARDAGIPMMTREDLDTLEGAFDVVTAVEVLEHVDQPLEVLRDIRRLLKPGGLFFFTTGNAEPYRSKLLAWRYVNPEVHISFFEPRTLRRALRETGFEPQEVGYLPGFTDIIRFKALKALRVRFRAIWEGLLPWPLLSRAADFRLRITAHPVGWAREINKH